MLNRRRKIMLLAGTPLAVLLLFVLTIALLLHSPTLLRSFINHEVSSSLGRPFNIRGDMSIAWHDELELAADDIEIANTPWGKAPYLAHFRRVELLLDPWKLLKRQIIIRQVVLDSPDIQLERQANGDNNWTFDQSGSSFQIRPGHVLIHTGTVSVTDPHAGTQLQAKIATVPAFAGQDALQLVATGTYHHQPAHFSGETCSLLMLENAHATCAVEMRGKVGTTEAHISGTVLDLIHLAGLDLSLDLRDTDMSRLYDLIGVVFPKTAPYHLMGQLQHAPKLWTLADFKGTVGHSDLSGSISLDLHRKLFMHANLHSNSLETADLDELIGKRPTPAVAGAHTSTRVLPQEPFDTHKLAAMDADVRFDIGKVAIHAVPVKNVSGRLYLHDSHLELDAAQLHVASGKITASLMMNGQRQPLHAIANLRVDRVNLHELLQYLPRLKSTTGLFSGHIYLDMHGNSTAQLLADANGKIMMAMESGQISSMLVKLAGIDLSGVLPYVFRGDRPQPINCAIMTAKVKNGLMDVRKLIVAARDSNIAGNGKVSLANETLDLSLLAKPHDFSLLRPRAPIHIGGTFAKPQVSVAKAEIVGRLGLAAVAGVVVAPLSALLLTSEIGQKPAEACPALLNDAQQFMKGVPQAPIAPPPAPQLEQRLVN